MKEHIETERLIIRHFNHDDVLALYRLLSDVEVNRFLPWYPLRSIEEAEDILVKKYLPEASKGAVHYAICLKSDNIPIGYVKAELIPPYDFGYAIIKEEQNRGYVTEAGKAVLEDIREKVPYITATHDINNPASGRVMQKLGMTYRYSYRELVQPKNYEVVFRMYQLDFYNSLGTYNGYRERYNDNFVEKL